MSYSDHGKDYTQREIIKWANSYCKIGNRFVKHYSDRADRTATRDALKTENYEKIPQSKRTAEENPWAWD